MQSADELTPGVSCANLFFCTLKVDILVGDIMFFLTYCFGLLWFACIFELSRQARLGRQPGIRLYRPAVPAEGQNKSWGHRLTAKAVTYQGRHLNKK
jgi:hypothetical protein